MRVPVSRRLATLPNVTDDQDTRDRPRILVACFGNVLRGDDGFGNAVSVRLEDEEVPDGVLVMEIGIGGIHLVQELMDGVDALVVVDAVDLGREPGTVLVVEPDVRDVSGLSVERRRDELADMHYATPDRALMLAKALGVLPRDVLLIGAQVSAPEQLGEGLSRALEGAVEPAVAELRRVVSELGIPWPPDGPRAA